MVLSQSQKAVVTAVRAEYHLSQGRVELAAKYMAQCPAALMPFADAATRLALPMLGGGDTNNEQASFSNHGGGKAASTKANEALASSNMALITFLNDKMKGAKSNNDSITCTILGTWLTELHLQERERDGGSLPSPGKRQTTSYLLGQPRKRRSPPVNHALLHQFLSSFVRDMDSQAIVNVLASHDISAGECAGYSAAAGDIGAAINAALSGEDEKVGDGVHVIGNTVLARQSIFV